MAHQRLAIPPAMGFMAIRRQLSNQKNPLVRDPSPSLWAGRPISFIISRLIFANWDFVGEFKNLAHQLFKDRWNAERGPDVGNTKLWDEISAAVLIDPTLITDSDDQYVDVVVDHGEDYGAIRFDSDNALVEVIAMQ